MSPGWLPTIVFSPLVAALVLLFVPSSQRILVRLIAIGSTVVSAIGSVIAAIGYDQAAHIAKTAYATQRNVREVAQELSGLDAAQLEHLLDSRRQTEPQG